MFTDSTRINPFSDDLWAFNTPSRLKHGSYNVGKTAHPRHVYIVAIRKLRRLRNNFLMGVHTTSWERDASNRHKVFREPMVGRLSILVRHRLRFYRLSYEIFIGCVRKFLEPPVFTSIVNVTDQLSKEFSENIRVWMALTRIIQCTFLCLITSSTIKGT